MSGNLAGPAAQSRSDMRQKLYYAEQCPLGTHLVHVSLSLPLLKQKGSFPNSKGSSADTARVRSSGVALHDAGMAMSTATGMGNRVDGRDVPLIASWRT